MKYHLDLFTPETWEGLRQYGANWSGFRERHRRMAEERVSPGDMFICYLTRLSRWCGLLKVTSEAYMHHGDDSPESAPFVVRFDVDPVVVLEPEFAIPVKDEQVWNRLTITKDYDIDGKRWTGFFRGSLNSFNDQDAEFLVELLKDQQASPTTYPLSDKDRSNLTRARKVRTVDGEVEVEVPESDDDDSTPESADEIAHSTSNVRESIQYQAKVAHIGAQMGLHIWLPRNDRARVLELLPEGCHEKVLDALPLNYDDATLRTIEQIDVLWLQRRSIVRAFEVEHTTAIYSGLLRMADLLALQPNMTISLHIVAPLEKREKVLREIRRPVFALLDGGPLYKKCSYLAYDAIDELHQQPHISHMKPSILEKYTETTEV